MSILILKRNSIIENNNEINSILDDFGAFEIIEIINNINTEEFFENNIKAKV